MATRHNTCINPCLTNNDTGWGDGGAEVPARTSVTGFVRSFGARYTTNVAGFIRTPPGAAVAGGQYTLSVYLKPTSAATGTIYGEWINGGGSVITYTSNGYTADAGVVTRISHTATAPENTASVRIIVDNINFSLNTTDFTAVLIEESAAPDTYFDGDSDGATWDGTAGNSASTLTDEPDTVIGSGAAVLGALSGTASGTRTVLGAAVASLGGLNATAVGGRTVVAVATASLGGLTATATGVRTVFGAANATLGVLAATIVGQVSLRGTGSAVLGGLVATMTVAPPQAAATTGSWYTLLDIAREARKLAEAELSQPPQACPNDGEPLRRGRNGILHCSFDGWTDQ